MKTTFIVPITGDTLTARNQREERACKHFIINIEVAAGICREEMADGYNTTAHDGVLYRAQEIEGFAKGLMWLGVMSREEYLHYLSSIFAGNIIEYVLRGEEACGEEADASPALTVSKLLQMGEREDFADIDVCDDYDERCYIAFCGGYRLTDAGRQEFADALDIEVIPCGAGGFTWTLRCDTGKQANACRRLFYAIAGYCNDGDFDEWFEEV